MKKPTVIDFFCGAGGFSEGFRQQGFDIIQGVDHWEPAIKTFNHNFDLNCPVKNILDFEESIEEIEKLPDTDVIIGSPPCVSFSNSNKSGKADKSLGVRLTEVFLRIVVVKKFKPDSKLKAWFMENVTNSTNYLARHYNFKDLGLNQWAKEHGYSPSKIVVSIEGNSVVINSAHYGSAQMRKRAITGELISHGRLIVPEKTHSLPKEDSNLPKARTLKSVKGKLPKPTCSKSSRKIKDPLYPEISLSVNKLTDHFYDSGLYKCQWKNSEFMKRNHPYMGRMSFPENENNPSRTVTATNIGTSREAIIYRSEYKRTGDGEYRVPTVREMACLMGFPITYQFVGGSESSKCRLVGNAVCPSVSRSLASTVRADLKLKKLQARIVTNKVNTKGVRNLNCFEEKEFNSPPRKNKGSRFRRHPFKYGNITVTISNYDITNGGNDGKWITSVQYGNGEGYPSENYPDNYFRQLEKTIKEFENGNEFIRIINNGFSEKIADAHFLQTMYEEQRSHPPYSEPTELIEQVASLIDSFKFKSPNFEQNRDAFFSYKNNIPKKQVLALYAINKICSITNNDSDE